MKTKIAVAGFVLSLAATWAWKTYMEQSVAPLTTREIVLFELARTPEQAAEWLAQWEESGMLLLAERSLYLDFIFLLIYPWSFFFACQALAATAPGRDPWAVRFSYLALAAAGFDALENLCLLHVLRSTPEAVVTHLAAAFAVIKFVSLAAILFFVVARLVSRGFRWVTS
jgi:hypothetical protein